MSATTLYRLWSEQHLLLYVGVTDNLDRRLKEHAADKEWWADVAQVTTEVLPSTRRALEAEARAIFWEQPRHNILGSPRYSADWEARCHALEDADAARAAMPDLSDDDYTWLSGLLARMQNAGMGDDANRLYDTLERLDEKARATL